MALVLFSLAKEVTPELEQGLDDAVSLVSDLREIFEEEKIILVATKYDLMPRHWCDVYVYLAREENRLAYPDNIELFKVSSTTGEGVDALQKRIGKGNSAAIHIMLI